MGGEVLVRGVEHDLALPRVGGDAGLEVVGRDARGGASEELERVDVAAQPGVLLHVEGRLDVAVPAEGQAGDEQVDLRDDAGRRVDEGHGRTGPVDLHVPARLAADPAHDVPADRELPVPLAEAVVGHRRLAPRGASSRYSPCRKLSVTPTFASSAWTASQSGSGYTGPGCSRSGNRRAYTSPALIRSASSQATSCSAAALSTTETLAFDACSAAAIALSDRFDDLSLGTSLAGILLAMIHSFLSTTGMASRSYRRRTGGARARMRAVLKRAAGGEYCAL